MEHLAYLFNSIGAEVSDESYKAQLTNFANFLIQVFKSHSHFYMDIMENIALHLRRSEQSMAMEIDLNKEEEIPSLSTKYLLFFKDERKFSNESQTYTYQIPGYQSNSPNFLMFNPSTVDSDLFFTICKIPSLIHLTSFTLNNVCLRQDLLLMLLFRALGLLTNLQKLAICNCEFPVNFQGEKEAFEAFGRSLRLMENMKEFTFMNNKMNNEWIPHFLHLPGSKISVFDSWRGLKKLRIGHLLGNSEERYVKENCTTFYAIKIMFEDNGHYNKFLSNIKIPDDTVDAKELKAFKQLENCFMLEELHLEGFNNIIKAGLNSNLIKNARNLFFLNLSNNNLRESDLRTLFIGYNFFEKLEAIIIENNTLSSNGFSYLISFASSYLKNLKTLSVKKNQIESLEQNLVNKQLISIQKLFLDSNNFISSQETVLCFILKNFNTLEKVSLKKCGVTIEFVESFISEIGRNLILIKKKKKEILIHPTSNEQHSMKGGCILIFKDKFLTLNLRKNNLIFDQNWFDNASESNKQEILNRKEEASKSAESISNKDSSIYKDQGNGSKALNEKRLPSDKRIIILY